MGEYPRARRPVCAGHPFGVRGARSERVVRSGDYQSQPLRRADAAISEIRALRKRQDSVSGSRSCLRDLFADFRWGRTISHSKNTTKLALAFLVGLPSAPVFAQVQNLPETVVSATGIPTDSSQIASSVTVITEEQIQRDQLRTLPGLLATVPGLNVVQTGGPGGQTSLFIRGMNADHVKVLVDGVDVSDPSAPRRVFDFGPLMTDDIDHIEILRGPQSGLYGADAMSGVISITTKKGSGPATWTATAEAGSFGTFNQSMQLSGGTINSNYAFTIAHNLTASSPVTPLELLAPGERRNNDWYNNYTYSGKIGADISDIFSVNFAGRYTDTKLHFTNDNFSNFPLVFPNFDQSFSTSHQFNGFSEGILKLFDDRLTNRFGFAYTDIIRRAMDPGALLVPFDGNRMKTYWRSNLLLAKGQILLLGIERDEERAQTSVVKASTGNTGAYAELQSSFSDRFFIVSNIRHDNNESFGGHDTWRVAPAFLITETETKLKASYGTGFNAPSLAQLYAPPSGNPNLRPEENKGYDYGFEQTFFTQRIKFGATWFHNDIKNLITFGPAPLFLNMNINNAQTHGLEAFVAAQLTNNLQMRTDYTHTIAIDLNSGVNLPRRPWDKTSVSLVWQPTDSLTLSATALWVSGWFDFDRFGFASAPFKTNGYKIVNLAANYKINQNVILFGRIDNFFDEHYQNPIGFEKPGLGVYAGLRLTK
jgi:vitamin B12 transporter